MQTDRKPALITGSGKNIGRGIAHHLAAAGFNIIINGSSNRDAAESVADEVRAYGVTALVVMGNVGCISRSFYWWLWALSVDAQPAGVDP